MWLREDEVEGQSQECSQNEQGHADDAPGPAPVALKEVGGGHGRELRFSRGGHS